MFALLVRGSWFDVTRGVCVCVCVRGMSPLLPQAIGIRLGTDAAFRSGVVAKLVAARDGPTFDAPRYARNFVHGMHVMYDAVCSNGDVVDSDAAAVTAGPRRERVVVRVPGE